MKHSIITLVIVFISSFFFSVGCTDKNGSSSDSLGADTLGGDSLPSDTLSELIEQEEMPVAADELFDDFFFNFAGSRKVQYDRIAFPLKVVSFGKVTMLEKPQWKKERFFMGQGYYTLIFNNVKQISLMKDTTVSAVTVERIAIPQSKVTRWFFARKRGQWQMDSITTESLKKHPDASFLSFYQRFVRDSTFQMHSLADPITFTGPDPEDDFSTMTGDIMPEQWPDFAPWLPSGTIYNIKYGNGVYPVSNSRYFYVRGIANGLQIDIVFNKIGKKWYLKKVNI